MKLLHFQLATLFCTLLALKVGFDTTFHIVNEDIGFVTLTVVTNEIPESKIEVDLRTEEYNSVAKENVDYEPITTTLTFAPGQTKATIDVTILDDDYVESLESFFVILSNSVGAELRSHFDSIIVDIIDNDILKVEFNQSSYNVSEDSGHATIFVVLNGIPNNEIKVDLATREGYATDDADFFPTTTTITFNRGQTQANVEIPIGNDKRVELTEYFYVYLSNPVGAPLGEDSEAIVNIIDDDTLEVTFIIIFYTVKEDRKFVTLSIRINDEFYSNIEVDLATRKGSATENSDYKPVNKTLTFLPSQGTYYYPNIEIADDNIVEPKETFYVELSNPKGASLGSNILATINIIDDDAIMIEFSSAAYENNEGQSTTITIVSNKVWHKDVKVKLYTYEYETRSGAKAPDDYESVDTELVFPMGKQKIVYQLQTLEDSRYDPAEWFVVRLSTADPDVVIGPKSWAIITITDPKEYGCSIYSGSCCIGPGKSCLSPANNCYCEITCRNFNNCCDDIGCF